MLKLIKKDLIAGRNNYLINLSILIFFSAVMYKVAMLDIFFFISIIYAAIIVISPIALEDKLKTNTLIASLPIRRSRIILSRYLAAIIMVILVITLVFLLGFAFEKIIEANYIEFSGSVNFGSYFSVLFFAIISTAFIIPFAYRFGQSGLMIGLAVGVLLQVVFFIIASFGFRLDLMRMLIGGFFERMEAGGLTNFFAAVSANIGIFWAVAVFFAAMALLIFLSCKISLFIFKRKEF